MSETLEHWHKEGSGFSGASTGHGDDVGAGENERHSFALDWSGDFVALAFDSSVDIGTET